MDLRLTRLGAVLTTMLVAATGAPAAQAKAGCADANLQPRRDNLHRIERATLCLTNRERARHGLAPLRFDWTLRRAARRHSTDMVRRRFYGHTSPGGSTVLTRAHRSRYLNPGHSGFRLAENIGYGEGPYGTPAHLHRRWMRSPSHRVHVLDGRLRDAAVGVVWGSPEGPFGATYTVDFGSR